MLRLNSPRDIRAGQRCRSLMQAILLLNDPSTLYSSTLNQTHPAQDDDDRKMLLREISKTQIAKRQSDTFEQGAVQYEAQGDINEQQSIACVCLHPGDSENC